MMYNRLLILLCSFGLIILIGCQQTPAAPTVISLSPTPTLPTATPLPPSRLPIPTLTPPPTQTPLPTATPDYTPYMGTPLNPDLVGIQVHIHQEDQALIFSHLEALHVGWVKVQVSWKLYQPEPDRYDDFRFDELDRFVATANDRSIQVLLSVAKAPEWSRPTTELDGPPSDFKDFGHFMRFLAERYQGQVSAYELWNEPNLQREWNGFTLGASTFIRLIREGVTAVREVDEEVLLISGAPAPTGINDYVSAIDDRDYLQHMVSSGLPAIVDAVGVHPYGWANPPDSQATLPDLSIPSHNNHPSFFFADTLHDYRRLVPTWNDDPLPLWVTEFGWGTFDGLNAPPLAGIEFMGYVDEWQQATYTLRALEMAQTGQVPAIGPLILWNLNFGPLLGTQFAETSYSILRPDGSPRPVYYALQQVLSTNP